MQQNQQIDLTLFVQKLNVQYIQYTLITKDQLIKNNLNTVINLVGLKVH